MILSILIPTVPDRKHLLERCLRLIGNYPDVEILTDNRPRQKDGGPSTGEKRNALIDRAQGEYFAFVDDDDHPQPDYINHLLTRIRLVRPDVVTFTGWMTTGGKNRVDWVIKLGEDYVARKDADGVTRYYRWPNHLACMRKEAVKSVRFEHITEAEDYKWSKQIRDRGLLKTSSHIESPFLYWYDKA